MSVDITALVLIPLLAISTTANIILILFVRRLMAKFSDTLGEIDNMSVEVDAFIESTEKLCESEVYLLGEEPSVKAVRNNAKVVMGRLEEIFRNIPSEWQIPEEDVAEVTNEQQG